MTENNEPNWNQIVLEIGPNLYRYFSGVFSSSVASDLVQETLIRLVQKFRSGDFNSQKGNWQSYAYGIARYVRLENYRSQSEFELVESLEDIGGVTQNPLEQSDPGTLLRWAIRQLKPLEQEIILLLIDEELSIEEISSLLELPEGTVKSHIHRTKDKLRQLMEDKL